MKTTLFLLFFCLYALQAKEIGSISGQIKAMYLIKDKTNTFTPRNGSAYLGKLKYTSPSIADSFSFATALYVNGDTGLTDWEDTNKKKAFGMFSNASGNEKFNLGEAYIQYKGKKVFAKLGRQIFNSPLTKISWSFMPNFYEAGYLSYKVNKHTSLNFLHVNRMSYGSRTAADYGLIGEKTGTAGTVLPVLMQSASGIQRATFLNLGTIAGVQKTGGMSAINVTYNVSDNLDLSLWNYHTYDIANAVYASFKYKSTLEDKKMTVEGQYLSQKDIGDSLAGSIDFTMLGLRFKMSTQKYSAYVGVNKSGNGGKFFNAWGADPAYTSSIFSRNEYRQNVRAIKVGGDYKLSKNTKIVASYANYGRSDTLGFGDTLSATDTADELNLIFLYYPMKNWMLKFFNVRRTSEYNTASVERKMNQYRFITSYKF